jgi:hypothetical protein
MPESSRFRVEIRRVGGAQAEEAKRHLGLIKVDTNSAERLFNAGIPFVVAPSKVNSFHFFGGWSLAMRVDPKRYKNEGWTFQQLLNDWSYYNEHSETGKAAFFVEGILRGVKEWRPGKVRI